MIKVLLGVGYAKTGLVIFLFFSVIHGLWSQSKEPHFLTTAEIKLAAPKIEMDSMLFKNSTSVLLKTSQGAVVRYTLDGSSVGTMSPEYTEPLMISSTVQLQAKAFHKDFGSSDEQLLNLRKIAFDISTAEVTIHPVSNESYSGTGVNTLVNGKKGTINFRNGNDWLGFQAEQVDVLVKFEQPIQVKKVVLSALQDQGSWIFYPKAISVDAGGAEIGSKVLEGSGKEGNKKMDFIEIPVEEARYSQLKISIKALDQIPNWHPGKGTIPWLFLDEILVE